MTQFSSALQTEIECIFQADLQRLVQQEAKLLHQRLDGTLRMEVVPTVLSEALRTENGKNSPNFPIIGFNGQAVRAAILLTLMRALRLDVFVETGTFRGDTCVLVAAQTDLPIHSCELNHRSQPVASALSELLKQRMQMSLMDSREFLREFFRETRFGRPFFYLDAHWEEDIPLLEELRIIFTSAAEYVIVIDDFRVPGDPGFGFDTYGAVPFDWDYIAPAFEGHRDQVSVFYPGYASSMETGAKRGFVMIASKALAPAIIDHVSPALLVPRPEPSAEYAGSEWGSPGEKPCPRLCDK